MNPWRARAASSSPVVHRRILVMADLWGPLYEWDVAGELHIADLDGPPISPTLRRQLEAWGEDWKDVSGHDYGRLPPKEAARLRREGNGLATST